MATVYAIFSKGSALDRALGELGGDVVVIPPRDLLSDAAGNYDGEGSDAVVPPAGPGGSDAGRLDGLDEGLPPAGEARAIGPESRLEGLPPDDRRDFDNALQTGASVLVVRGAAPALAEELRAAGADRVVVGGEGGA